MQSLPNLRTSRVVLLLAAFAAAAVASAATLTVPFTVTPGGTPQKTDWSLSAAIAPFDSTKGTLTSVSFDFDYATDLQTQIATVNGNGGTFAYGYDLDLYVYDENTEDPNNKANILLQDNRVKLATTEYSGSLDAGEKTTQISLQSGTKTGFLLPEYLPRFTEGSQTLWFFAHAFVHDASATGRFNFDVDTSAALSGRVVYNYQPVPEPASMAALGLGALALVRRRKVSR